MTSERRLRANRSNAKASTGPRTSAGKAQSARNAFRHGLSLPLTFDSALGRQVEELARRIAGETPDPVRFRLAQQIAEAQSQLQRVRARRLDLIASALADPSYKPLAMVRQQAAAGIAVLSGMGMTLGELEEVDRTLKMRPLEGPEKLAAILGDLARELARLHRYERRALSRRKSATREFDKLSRTDPRGAVTNGSALQLNLFLAQKVKVRFWRQDGLSSVTAVF